MLNTEQNIEDFQIPHEHKSLVKPIEDEILSEIHTKLIKRNVFYMYPQAEEIIQVELRSRFLDYSDDSNDRGRIVFIWGKYNVGKSYLLKYAHALFYKEYKKLWNKKKFPILRKNLPDDIRTGEGFLLWLLDVLGGQVDPKQLKNWEKLQQTRSRLIDRVIKYCVINQTRLFILDEAQRLLQAKNVDLTGIFEVIKDLLNGENWIDKPIKTCFLLVGTPEMLPLLAVEDWIHGRAHGIHLDALEKEEYVDFLFQIYDDFIKLGISEEWDLVYVDEKGEETINPQQAKVLYDRSMGKPGLTVEILREAAKRSLNMGRLYPKLKDYITVIIDGTEISLLNENGDLISKREKLKYNTLAKMLGEDDAGIIVYDIKDLTCKIPKCSRNDNPYSNGKWLLKHYKREHPKYTLQDKRGNILN